MRNYFDTCGVGSKLFITLPPPSPPRARLVTTTAATTTTTVVARVIFERWKPKKACCCAATRTRARPRTRSKPNTSTHACRHHPWPAPNCPHPHAPQSFFINGFFIAARSFSNCPTLQKQVCCGAWRPGREPPHTPALRWHIKDGHVNDAAQAVVEDVPQDVAVVRGTGPHQLNHIERTRLGLPGPGGVRPERLRSPRP